MKKEILDFLKVNKSATLNDLQTKFNKSKEKIEKELVKLWNEKKLRFTGSSISETLIMLS